jgi:hypothetical protein
MALTQAKKSANQIDFKLDLQPLTMALGAANALARVQDDKFYIDALMDAAFEELDDEFNERTAAGAVAGSGLTHMYEWGTIGVNPGKTNIRLNPNNPAARLWQTFTVGSGMDRQIGFIFRPSVANVPKPTAGKTGMSTDVIESMRDYQFTWKAQVIEEGQTITISPKRRFLLIPAYKENRWWMDPWDIRRGYALLTRPVTFQAGKGGSAGHFTEWWFTFWAEEAPPYFAQRIEDWIEEDYFPTMATPRKKGTMRPVGTYSVKKEMEKSEAAVKKRAAAKARLRRARAKAMNK